MVDHFKITEHSSPADRRSMLKIDPSRLINKTSMHRASLDLPSALPKASINDI